MAICATAIEQPDGSFLLGLDLSKTDVSTCVYVVQTADDWINSIFHMSAEDGLTWSAAIFSLWALAWSFKTVASLVRGNENVEHET